MQNTNVIEEGSYADRLVSTFLCLFGHHEWDDWQPAVEGVAAVRYCQNCPAEDVRILPVA